MPDAAASKIFLAQLRRWGNRNNARTWAKLAKALDVDRVTLWRWRQQGIEDNTIRKLTERFPGILNVSASSAVLRHHEGGAHWPVLELWSSLASRGVVATVTAISPSRDIELRFASRSGVVRISAGAHQYKIELLGLADAPKLMARGPVTTEWRARLFRYARALLSSHTTAHHE